MESQTPSQSPAIMLTFADFNRPDRSGRQARDNGLEVLGDPLSRTSTLTNNSPNPTRRSSRSRSRSRPNSRSSSMERLKHRRLSLMSDQVKDTHKYLGQELDIHCMGAVILICFFTSGLIDSVAFNSWNCFVGMQTGEHRSAPPRPSSSLATQLTDAQAIPSSQLSESAANLKPAIINNTTSPSSR